MKKQMKALFIVASALMLINCGGNAKSQTDEEPMAKAVSALVKVAPMIDSDDESYWGYETADSLLKEASAADKQSVKDKDVYDAISHVFYGMSYTRSLNFGAKGLQSIADIVHRKAKYQEPFDSEVNAVNSYIVFYEVSRMPSAPEMRGVYEKYDSVYQAEAAKVKDASKLNRYMAINNKKLFFKTFAPMLIDLGDMQNDIKQLSAKVKAWGESLDKIPSDSCEQLNALTDQAYQQELTKATKIQTEMINQLSTYIGGLQ